MRAPARFLPPPLTRDPSENKRAPFRWRAVTLFDLRVLIYIVLSYAARLVSLFSALIFVVCAQTRQHSKGHIDSKDPASVASFLRAQADRLDKTEVCMVLKSDTSSHTCSSRIKPCAYEISFVERATLRGRKRLGRFCLGLNTRAC